ncbi:MAG: hypothetical protein GX071_10335 [Gammaproteobacteria bacterium]|nr:hypothetical protein [Gammaproteobacteria bacterium]
MTDQTPQQRNDAALESILRAAGTSLKHYMPSTQEAMRKAVLKVRSDSYIAGSNAAHEAAPLSGFDLNWLITAATRYSVTRKTIAASCFAGELATNWDSLPPGVQSTIKQDMEDAFRMADEYPTRWDACDRAAWEKVRSKWK